MQFLLIILSDSSWGWVTLYWTTNGNNRRSPQLLSGWSLHQFRSRTQLRLAKVAAAGPRREIVKLFWREKRVILLLLFLIRPGTDCGLGPDSLDTARRSTQTKSWLSRLLGKLSSRWKILIITNVLAVVQPWRGRVHYLASGAIKIYNCHKMLLFLKITSR